MPFYCVVCHDEFEVQEDFVNVHTDCLGVDDALKSAISKGVKGISRRVVNGKSLLCEFCDLPGVNASVSICRICFIAVRKNCQNSSRLNKSEQEKIAQDKKLERERFVRMTTRTPNFEIRVCSSCNLPIRQFDSRCGCS
jgi:hypothetical protein